MVHEAKLTCTCWGVTESVIRVFIAKSVLESALLRHKHAHSFPIYITNVEIGQVAHKSRLKFRIKYK